MKLWTIGYEGRTLPEFLDLLRSAGVTLVCDVRHNPTSRKKGFSKGTLRKALEEADIRYEHLPELGIASARRRNLRTPAQKAALFASYERDDLPRRKTALRKIAEWARGERVALLCFERSAADCHRSRTARALDVAPVDL